MNSYCILHFMISNSKATQREETRDIHIHYKYYSLSYLSICLQSSRCISDVNYIHLLYIKEIKGSCFLKNPIPLLAFPRNKLFLDFTAYSIFCPVMATSGICVDGSDLWIYDLGVLGMYVHICSAFVISVALSWHCHRSSLPFHWGAGTRACHAMDSVLSRLCMYVCMNVCT